MKIAIITGGESGERDVSINSAANIAAILSIPENDIFTFPEDKEKFVQDSKNFDIVIPVIHGPGGEDGEVQMFLDGLKLPYLFSTVATHKLGIDKLKTKKVANSLEIKTADTIDPTELSFPLFAKPNSSGSSLAAELCENEESLGNLKGRFPDTEFIYEQPIKGREFTVGIIESEGENISLPVIEIITKTGVFDYNSKYDSDNLATEVCPAEISAELASELQSQALKVHEHLGVRHMSRSDFIVDGSGKIYFLEINTIPGLTKTSLIPKMIEEAGLEIKDLFLSWIEETR